jgi:hypothetical protein
MEERGELIKEHGHDDQRPTVIHIKTVCDSLPVIRALMFVYLPYEVRMGEAPDRPTYQENKQAVCLFQHRLNVMHGGTWRAYQIARS